MRRKTKNENRYLLNNKALLRNAGDGILTTSRYNYNCGGFALGRIGSWYCPRDGKFNWGAYEDLQNIWDMFSEDYYNSTSSVEDDAYIEKYDEICTAIGRMYVDAMERMGHCREIESENELRADEYLVLFRASYDDFHYVRRLDNGEWYSKMGGGDISQITEEEAYGRFWWNELPCCYAGKLYRLAVKSPSTIELRCRRNAVKHTK